MLRSVLLISVFLTFLGPGLSAQAQGVCFCCDGVSSGRVFDPATCNASCQAHQGQDFFRHQNNTVQDLGTCAPETAGGQLEAAAQEPKVPVVGFGNPLCPDPRQVCDIPSILGRGIKAILGVVGAIGLVMFIWGGFRWMASRGNLEEVKKAKELLTWSTLGLLVIFASYLIVNFVIERLQP